MSHTLTASMSGICIWRRVWVAQPPILSSVWSFAYHSKDNARQSYSVHISHAAFSGFWSNIFFFRMNSHGPAEIRSAV